MQNFHAWGETVEWDVELVEEPLLPEQEDDGDSDEASELGEAAEEADYYAPGEEVYDDPFTFEVELPAPDVGFMLRAVLMAAVLIGGLLVCLTARLVIPPTPAAASGQPVGQAAQAAPPASPQAGAADEQPGRAVSQECSVSDRFPPSILQWCGLITHYAKRHGLHPDLVAALIWQESGGKALAYSRNGAVGLMQVMPSDGLAASFMCANGPCFADRPSTGELQDPEFNINYGTRMLAGLVRRQGDLREALKSYGPMNVGYYYADRVLGLFKQYGQP